MPFYCYDESSMELETAVVRDRLNQPIYTTYLFHISPPKPMLSQESNPFGFHDHLHARLNDLIIMGAWSWNVFFGMHFLFGSPHSRFRAAVGGNASATFKQANLNANLLAIINQFPWRFKGRRGV